MLSAVVFVICMLGIAAYGHYKISKEGLTVSSATLIGFMVLGGIFLSQIVNSIVIVNAGERVVVFDKFTGVKPTALGEGLHLIIPFIQEPIRFDVRVQKDGVDTIAASKDLQDVSTTVTLNVHPKPEAVPQIYQRYGKGYADKVIQPAIQESVKSVTALYTAEELITKREEVKQKIQQQLSAMLRESDLILDETYITNFKFSEGFSHAIEQKQIAEQDALRAQRDLQRVKIEADQKIAQAKAEAESLRMQKEAITDQLIQLRRIEAQRAAIAKWDGQLPKTILGNGTMPFIDISK